MPGTSRLDRETRQVTVARTLAGSPTGTPNPDTLTRTTGPQLRPSWPRAACALDMAAAWAAAGVSEIEACRAASWAAAATEPCATDVRPAAMTRPSRKRITGARMTSSSAALRAAARGLGRVRRAWVISGDCELLDRCMGRLGDGDHQAGHDRRHVAGDDDLVRRRGAARSVRRGAEQVAAPAR